LTAKVTTQALDRLLEALSPALAAELERVSREMREALEQEFQGRLEAALRDAEAAWSSTAQLQLERAVEETRNETRRQMSEEIEQQFESRLAAATAEAMDQAAEERAGLEARIRQMQAEWTAESAALERELERWRIFSQTQRQLAEASSQPEILARFLVLAQAFAHSVAVYVNKPAGLTLWKSKGDAAFPQIATSETADSDYYLRRLSVRGIMVGAVCAAPPFTADALDFLAASLEHAIEVFGLRLRASASRTAVP
jgi:hypothetical protein